MKERLQWMKHLQTFRTSCPMKITVFKNHHKMAPAVDGVPNRATLGTANDSDHSSVCRNFPTPTTTHKQVANKRPGIRKRNGTSQK